MNAWEPFLPVTENHKFFYAGFYRTAKILKVVSCNQIKRKIHDNHICNCLYAPLTIVQFGYFCE